MISSKLHEDRQFCFVDQSTLKCLKVCLPYSKLSATRWWFCLLLTALTFDRRDRNNGLGPSESTSIPQGKYWANKAGSITLAATKPCSHWPSMWMTPGWRFRATWWWSDRCPQPSNLTPHLSSDGNTAIVPLACRWKQLCIFSWKNSKLFLCSCFC